MTTCIVCGADDCREELVDDVFNVDGRYVLVGSVPATVCGQCGEKTFSRESTENVRRIVHEGPKASETMTLEVYKYG
ncbi:MAG: YgiT-type zinc finger protein [Chloroflexi bacterium]|nr:YgiT-type zinc finger protein [Chloroflexota bacterium]